MRLRSLVINDNGNEAERGLIPRMMLSLLSHMTSAKFSTFCWVPGPGEHASSSSGTSGRFADDM